MGEYLELVSQLREYDLDALLEQELGNHTGLLSRLQRKDGTISTKLATCNDVFLTFEEMVALYWFSQRHQDVLHYGPSHAYNSTLEEILRDRTSLYLGPWETRGQDGKRSRVPAAVAAELEHYTVWRRTRKVLSRTGKTYYRKVPPGPNGLAGYRAPCPNTAKPFTAREAGYAWDASTNRGRIIYRCPPCGSLFNMGEDETPQYATLGKALRTGYARQRDHIGSEARPSLDG